MKNGVVGWLCIAAIVILAPIAERRTTAQTGTADANEGRQLFATYCATCHGTNGGGNGPVAPWMRHRPPDITGMALANGGVFPEERMRRIIDGREVESHGTREMPVWGDAFKTVPGGERSEQAVQRRIAAVVQYLASIQKRRA